MTKKLLILLIATVSLLALVLVGCKKNKNPEPDAPTTDAPSADAPTPTPDTPSTDTPSTDTPSTDTPSDTPTDSAPTGVTVFSGEVQATVISPYRQTDGAPYTVTREIWQTIADKSGLPAGFLSDSEPLGKNEIVIGDSNRDITDTAYRLLDARIKREVRDSDDVNAVRDVVGFAVYSKGGSVAVVWSDEHIEERAITYFLENYVISDSLVLRDGYIRTEIISLSEHLEERGEIIKAEAWDTLAEKLPSEYSGAIITSLRNLYGLYSADMVSWYANLGDPETGGFYYTNTARDTYGFLPDLESTDVTVTFIETSGMAEMRGGDWTNVIPEWWQEKMAAWVLSLRDDNGFYYHPQWPKEFVESNGLQSKVTRDKSSGDGLLRDMGISTSAVSYSGYSASEIALTAGLGRSAATAVSGLAITNSMLSQYESAEKFAVYLAGLEAEALAEKGDPVAYANKFYTYGNTFQSSTNYIMADPQIRQMLIDFFYKYQNPENGLWSDTLNYAATNGLHKITSVFNTIGAPLKYTDKMFESTFQILSFDMTTPETTANTGVSIYNAWSCFSYIVKNLKEFGEGEESVRLAKVDEYMERVYFAASRLIDNTYNQISGFRCEDGTFGYYRDHASMGIQGAPASLGPTNEGDANGNGIASYVLIQYILRALGVHEYMPPLFTEAECVKFINILEDLGPVIKDEAALDEEMIYDFEEYDEGELPPEMSLTLANGANSIIGNRADVVELDDGNKVLEYVGRDRGTDPSGRNKKLSIDVPNVAPNPNVSSFDFDMYVVSAGSRNYDSAGKEVFDRQLIQWYLYNETGGITLYFTLRMNSEGEIWIYDAESSNITSLGKADEWIDFRLDYYWNEGVYKIYVDGVFKADGMSTYQGAEHAKIHTSSMITPSTVNSCLRFDNLSFARRERKYVEGSRELLDEKLYNFTSETLSPDLSFEGTEWGSENGSLALSGAKVTVPQNFRSYLANAAVVTFDISVPGAENFTEDTVVSEIEIKNEAGALLWRIGVGVDSDGYLYFEDEKCLPNRVSTTLSAKEWSSVRVEAFYGAGVGRCDNILLLYIDGRNEPILYTLTMAETPDSSITPDSLTLGSLIYSGKVLYDNVKAELVPRDFISPIEYPTVEEGADSPTIDFEDYNVGTLPDRIWGDASVGIELDGTNRFLQIIDNDKKGSSTVVIDMFNSVISPNATVIELELELLTGTTGDLITFALVDSLGNEEEIFKLRHAAYSNGFALRPRTAESYSKELYEANPELWKWTTPHNELDGAPNVISRENYINGIHASTPAKTKVIITLEIDWVNQKVNLKYNEGRNTFYKNIGETVYSMALSDIASLKLITNESMTSVFNIDYLRAENIYISERTANEGPTHTFDGIVNGDAINGFIGNGVEILPASGKVSFGGTADKYLEIQSGRGQNPGVNIPTYTSPEVVAGKSVIKLDMQISELSSENSLSVNLIDWSGKSVGSIVMREVGGRILMYHYAPDGTSVVRYIYDADSFAGSGIPLVTESAYESLSETDRAGLVTRFTLVIEYSYVSGLMSVNIEGADGKNTPIYTALCGAIDGIGSVSLEVAGGVRTSLKLYGAYVENLYEEEGGAILFEPTNKGFESEYTATDKEWDCTHADHTGDKTQNATNLDFGNGVKVEFATDKNTSNTHGATAKILTDENGNHYLEMKAPNRISSRDRGYTLKISAETCSSEPNLYVLESSFYFDSQSTYKGFLQMRLYNGKNYVDLYMDKSTKVSLCGIILGDYDEWIDLRLEYFADKDFIRVYVGGVYLGAYTAVSASSDSANKTVSALGGAITSVNISGVNSTSGSYVMRIDNVKLYSTSKTYTPASLPTKVEDFESDYTVNSSGVAPNISFDSGTSISYSGKVNDAATYAEVVTEGANTYISVIQNKRVNTSDRSYNVKANAQNSAVEANGYVFEAKIRVSSESEYGDVMQLIVRAPSSANGSWLFNKDKSGGVGFADIKLGEFDEWIDIRMEIRLAEDKVLVYARGEGEEQYKLCGTLTSFRSVSKLDSKDISSLPDTLVSVDLSGYNANGNAAYDLDDIAFYTVYFESSVEE